MEEGGHTRVRREDAQEGEGGSGGGGGRGDREEAPRSCTHEETVGGTHEEGRGGDGGG